MGLKSAAKETWLLFLLHAAVLLLSVDRSRLSWRWLGYSLYFLELQTLYLHRLDLGLLLDLLLLLEGVVAQLGVIVPVGIVDLRLQRLFLLLLLVH